MEPTRQQGPAGGSAGGSGGDPFNRRGFESAGATSMPDGGPLRRMVGGISAVMVIAWTLLCLAFYALIELVGSLLVWLARSVFEAQGLADFFAGLFGVLQDVGFVTVAVVWLIGVLLAIGFNLVTHRATRDAEARWSQRRGDRARPVGDAPGDGSGDAPRRRARPGDARKPEGRGGRRPVTIDLRRDGDTYR